MLLMKAGASKGGRALATAMGIKLLRPSGRNIHGKTIINWGVGTRHFNENFQRAADCTIINDPDLVARASNKLHCLTDLSAGGMGMEIVPFTNNADEARHQWLEESNGIVVIRGTLHGHSGRGITLQSENTDLPHAPLYTKYIKKAHEYRVHVIGDATDVQMKRKRQETPNEEVDYQVRNHSTGWVYCRAIGEIDNRIRDLAVRAIGILGLDFGAVDIIYNRKQDKYYILEVNTAPGLEGTTIDFYSTELAKRGQHG